MEELNQEKVLEEDLKKVERESMAKAVRHRLDEYIETAPVAAGLRQLAILVLAVSAGI